MTSNSKIVNKSVAELLTETQAQLATAEAARDLWQGNFRAESDQRRKLNEEVGALRATASNAQNEAARADTERRDLFRALAYAEGYIAALKGDPYPSSDKAEAARIEQHVFVDGNDFVRRRR